MTRRPVTGANRAGKRMEAAIADMLDERGYLFVDRFRFFPARILEQAIYTRQCIIGTDIYGKERRVDAILYHPLRWPGCLVVQCKWQSIGGSVDEKYPFEVLSIAEGGFDTVIVLDGGGYSEGARNWLVGRAGQDRLLKVRDQGGFARFARTRL